MTPSFSIVSVDYRVCLGGSGEQEKRCVRCTLVVAVLTYTHEATYPTSLKRNKGKRGVKQSWDHVV